MHSVAGDIPPLGFTARLRSASLGLGSRELHTPSPSPSRPTWHRPWARGQSRPALGSWGLLQLPPVARHSWRQPALSPAVPWGSPAKRNLGKSICISIFGRNKIHHFAGQHPRAPQGTRLPSPEAHEAGRDSGWVKCWRNGDEPLASPRGLAAGWSFTRDVPGARVGEPEAPRTARAEQAAHRTPLLLLTHKEVFQHVGVLACRKMTVPWFSAMARVVPVLRNSNSQFLKLHLRLSPPAIQSATLRSRRSKRVTPRRCFPLLLKRSLCSFPLSPGRQTTGLLILPTG